MIKRNTLILIILSFAVSLFSMDINFYIPSLEEFIESGEFYLYLQNLDSKKSLSENDEKELEDLYIQYLDEKSYNSYTFDAFLRQTKNKKIKKVIEDYIVENFLKDPKSISLFRLYNSKLKWNKNKQTGRYKRYSYEDKLFDENINLFTASPLPLFDEELLIYLFHNEWITKFDSYIEDKKMHIKVVICGGDTSAYTIIIHKVEDVSEEDFKKDFLDNNPYTKGFEDFKTIEVPQEGMHQTNKADLMYFTSCYLKDKSGIENMQFITNLYNRENKTGYSITYFFNISPANNYFELRKDLFSHVAISSLLTFIYK